jgi:hypothetical protein
LRPLLKKPLKVWRKKSIKKRFRRGILMKVINPMGNKKNLLIPLARIMRTWLKRESMEILNMMMRY